MRKFVCLSLVTVLLGALIAFVKPVVAPTSSDTASAAAYCSSTTTTRVRLRKGAKGFGGAHGMLYTGRRCFSALTAVDRGKRWVSIEVLRRSGHSSWVVVGKDAGTWAWGTDMIHAVGGGDYKILFRSRSNTGSKPKYGNSVSVTVDGDGKVTIKGL